MIGTAHVHGMLSPWLPRLEEDAVVEQKAPPACAPRYHGEEDSVFPQSTVGRPYAALVSDVEVDRRGAQVQHNEHKLCTTVINPECGYPGGLLSAHGGL